MRYEFSGASGTFATTKYSKSDAVSVDGKVSVYTWRPSVTSAKSRTWNPIEEFNGRANA